MYRFESGSPPVDVVVVEVTLDVVDATVVVVVMHDGCRDGSHSSLPQEEAADAPAHATRKSRRGGAALDMLGRNSSRRQRGVR